MSETKPTMDTASELPADPQGCPAFVTMKGGGSEDYDEKGRAIVVVTQDRDTPEVMHLRVNVVPYNAPGCSVAVRVILPATKGAGRKLRRLSTFARDQKRFPQEMDVQDELRAMEVLAKTLDSLPDTTGFRVLSWLNSRHQTKPAPMTRGPAGNAAEVSPEESVRIAKERVTS